MRIFKVFTLIAIISSLCSCQKSSDSEFPNIIFIMADDMGYGDLSCLNQESGVTTPHMDRIANEGMIFSDAHSPSAVCTPTRYGVLTGRYCFRTSLKSGVLVGHSPSLIEPERMTVAELLDSAGYHTACIGKWHLGLDWARYDTAKPLINGSIWNRPDTKNVDYTAEVNGGPADHGFDFSFIIPASLDMTPYCYISNKKLIAPIKDTTPGQNQPRGVFWRPGDLQEGVTIESVLPRLTKEAVKYIDSRAGEKQPFFLYFPLTAPHTPWLPLEEFQGSSDAGIYGDFVAQVDWTIGQVLKALDDNNMVRNTLVIVTSDNGSHWTPNDKKLFPHRANAGFSGMKSDAWEGGHHVPYVLRWPEKVKKGSRSDEVTTLTDLFATVAEITGQELPVDAAEDSYSMLPAILGTNAESIREGTIHHSISGMFALRVGEWKFIDGRGSGGWTYPGSEDEPAGQLYNMILDPQEKNNLFEKNPDQVQRMKDLLDQYKNTGRSR